ncbi:hypothetical protein LCL90_23075 [Bacillus infantis]|uniref:hypothetical protein n=1 Tax=Bacillus infantis TaxID=324767 RepID=UPI001CD73C49|nr:hypothetical protein [Bacillus infantis]MCA1037518.1 hypothetical protein [Bacillus infantis]
MPAKKGDLKYSRGDWKELKHQLEKKRMKETAFEEERLMLQLDKVRVDDEVNTSKYSMVDIMDALKKIKKNWDKLNDMQKKNLIDKIISKIEINFINGRLKASQGNSFGKSQSRG